MVSLEGGDRKVIEKGSNWVDLDLGKDCSSSRVGLERTKSNFSLYPKVHLVQQRH